MTPVSALALEVIYHQARRENIDRFVQPLNAAMERYDIVTPERQSAFLAQVGQESGQLTYVREIYSGEKYDTGPAAVRLGNTPAADGDGELFRGRGLIQITGRDNYRKCSIALFNDAHVLIDKPELLEQPQYAAMSAAWYWYSHGLNELADEGNFREITRRINGGYSAYGARLAFLETAQQVLL